MIEKKKRKYFREKLGMVFRIPLGDTFYGYGQITNETEYAFFDYTDNAKNTKIDDVINSKMIFKIVVQIGPLHDDIWEVLGIYPVDEKNAQRKDRFKYDDFKDQYFVIPVNWNIDNKFEIPSTAEEIRKLGLECFASWGYKLVEDRLRDHFADRKCYWVEADLNEHDPNFPDVETFYREQGYDYVWEGDPDDD